MADREFDNIEVKPDASQTQNNSDNGLDGLMRLLSMFIPCIPQYEELGETPNIDQIKEILQRFQKNDSSETDTSIVSRVNKYELCQWSEKVLSFLPNVTDSHEAGTVNTVTHFNTLKKFYSAVQNAGMDSCAELDLLFNTVQIYEAVMSISFVAFQEHPETLQSVNSELTKAIEKVEGYQTEGCLSMACCAAAILSQYNLILANIDKFLGEMGVVHVAEFIAKIIEVFCKFFDVDMQDFQNFSAVSQTIQEFINKISSTLKTVFGDDIPKNQRSKKWGALDITERINTKLSKFEAQAPIVQRTVNSFHSLYSAMEKLDDDFEIEVKKTHAAQQTASEHTDASSPEDMHVIEMQPLLAAQIVNNTEANFEEIKTIGRLFQNLETIMSYGILLFKNENDLLEPLLDHVDESTHILEKFVSLHPLYKVLCGKNYLSKLKVVFKKIVQLLENSKLKLNSPKAFFKEFNQNYPNLLYILCESYINDKFKKKLEKLPDPIENFLNDTLDGALNSFKNKFKL